MRKFTEEKLEGLIALDIIEPVEGPRACVSPPLFVPKGSNIK